MKKEYISPEVKILEFGLDDGILTSTSGDTSVGRGPDDGILDSRDNYDDNTPTRPGSGNIWDQGW